MSRRVPAAPTSPASTSTTRAPQPSQAPLPRGNSARSRERASFGERATDRALPAPRPSDSEEARAGA
eukprot:11917396-Alexandrium_andersonii.AAC.1